MTRFKSVLKHVVFWTCTIGLTLWSATALWVHLGSVAAVAALSGAGLLAVIFARWRSARAGWGLLLVMALISIGCYQSLRPLQDRDWATDVARGVTAQIDGQMVTLADLRDFDWQDRDTAQAQWITRRYDLDQLQSVDAITSVWDSPDIAHILARFNFADQEPVVFSVEIRREADEKFSEIGGFFRQFELVLIAATEQDILDLRTEFRGEEVTTYRLNLDKDQMQALFLAYAGLAQDLEKAPRFYNTVSANCTTVIYGMAHRLDPDLPLDWRLVLTGHVPEYLKSHGIVL